MKKSSLVNLTIVVGLLVVCVTTLVVIYATTPESESESTVLVLEENFDSFDGQRWQPESGQCYQDESRLRYSTQQTTTFVKQGILHIRSTSDENNNRTTREIQSNCTTCLTRNTCEFFQLRTKSPIEATQGKIVLRAKLAHGLSFKSWIGVEPNDTEPEQILSSHYIIETVGCNSTNGTRNFVAFTEPSENSTLTTSGITTGEYHVYVIEWNNATVKVKVDDQIICPNSNKSFLFQQPFYLSLGVDLGKNVTEKQYKRSAVEPNKEKQHQDSTYSVDYIKVYKIVNMDDLIIR